MSEPTAISTHVADGVGNLASQYRNAQYLTWLLEALLVEVQEVEDVLWEIYSRDIDTATGEALAGYGRLAGTTAEGVSDDLFRRRILGEFRVNRSTGKISDLVGLLESLTSESPGVVYREYYPAQVSLEYFWRATDDAWRDILTPTLQRAASLGVLVGPVVEAADVDGEGIFGFYDDPDAEGFGVGQFSTIVDIPRGDLFYYDLEDGYHEICPMVDAGGLCL